MIITQAITAGTWFEYYEPGDFFRILTDSAATTFDVEYYSAGKEIVDAASVKAGYSERFIGGGFDRIKIRATVDSTVQFVIRLGNVVGYDIAPTGQVSGTVAVNGVTNSVPFLTQAPKTVSSTTGTMLVAKAGRKYVFVQNKDPVGNIWLNFGGGATQANGILIGPGESFEMTQVVPSGNINAIGDLVSNPNTLFVEA